MLNVFLRDLVGPKRLISGVLVIFVAVVIANNFNQMISARVYLIATVASAIMTNALSLSSYYRVESLKQYVCLPGSSGAFFISLALSLWLLVLIEATIPGIVFGLVSGEIDTQICVLMFAYSLSATGWVLLIVVQRHSWVWMLGVLVIASQIAAIVISSSAVFLVVFCVVSLSIVVLCLTKTTNFALLADRTPRTGQSEASNYFLVVLARQKIVLSNGLVLLAFSIVFALASWKQGITIPFAFVLVGVNSPLGTIISGDQDLRIQFSMLGCPKRMLIHYGITVALYYSVGYAILVGFYFWLGIHNLVGLCLLTIACVTIQAFAVPMIELHYPITARTQRDIWRHPRKYLLPVVLTGVSILFAL